MGHLRQRRPLIVSCMADVAERPEVACGAASGANRAWAELRRYLERLKAMGRMDSDVNINAAGAMFMSAAFGDAMGREMISEMFPRPAESAAREYTKLFLRAIAPRPTRRTNGRDVAVSTTTGDNRQ
jgi:hypothetical protein